jgi:ABC-type phosphate/phosphonate transport system substrate-binding protein
VIANARMYSVTPEVARLWAALLDRVIAQVGAPVTLVEHPAPLPIEALWARSDKAAVLMCGLPFSLGRAEAVPIAAPVPSSPAYGGRPVYWSELIVRADSTFASLRDTLGQRVALTTLGSQSGFAALLPMLAAEDHPSGRQSPPFRQIIGPTLTPLGSVRAVLEGAAEMAPIDSVALDLLRRHAPGLTDRLRVIGRTAETPIPIFVASPGLEPVLSHGLLAAHEDPHVRDLLIERFVPVDVADYAGLRHEYARMAAHWRDRPLAEDDNPAFRFG